MQDCYVGDIGDYIKLAILRALMPGRRLGVAWWLYPNKSDNRDGRHIGYLDCADEWRKFDPELFDKLQAIVAAGDRRVAALQQPALLPGATYCEMPVPTSGTFVQRSANRAAWFNEVKASLNDRDFVFIDPDNGLETASFKPGAPKAGKSISLEELCALRAPGRTLVVYHHQTRMVGGHHYELRHWGERLRALGFETVDALRARPYSPRAFFLLDAPEDMRSRTAALAERWGDDRLSWHPALAAH